MTATAFRRGCIAATAVVALLRADAARAQLVANGQTLTATTTNAVATFNGADLVGFVNSLTNETYLKKPSDGHLGIVDAISPTPPAMQPSNWTIGTEAGTGLPLATIVSSDSLRSLTVTVKVDPVSQEIVLRTSASVTSPGVRGASWSIAGLDLAAGQWIVPANSGSVFDAGHPGIGAFIAYPNSWQAQMAVYQAAAGSLLLYSTDTQIFFKDLRQTTRGDSTLDVAVQTEATAPWPSATTVPSVEWRLKAFTGDWRAAAQPFRAWMAATYPPVSSAAHPWVSNIRTVVEIGYQDTSLLTLLAAKVNPSQTLLYIPDWRQYGYDVNYPDYTPAPGVAAFIAAAHTLGFKVMLHTDIVGVSPTNGDYASVQQYQAKTPDTLQPIGQFWDQPGNPQRYGLIDPAASAFRSLWIARIGAAVNALSPDALHLDFTAMYNDGNGPIEGRTYTQGEAFFSQQIIAAFPNVAIGCEEEFDFTYAYHWFAQADLFAFSAPGHPISPFLFSPQVFYYSNLTAPPPSDPSFKSHLLDMQRRTILPMWWVTGSGDLDTTNADNARFIGMVQSFQTHQFQPAWTSDWTGALARYQGLAGSTAALTDDGRITGLRTSTPQSTLFELAHDTNQITTGSFVNRWPAFDDTALYGLNPRTMYFLDSVARPDATHATTLPPGVQLDSGTLVTPSFAHFEFAAPPSVDFFDLGHARLGVRYQNVDYPIGFGAVVANQTHSVGGDSRQSLFIHPPWQGQVGGETFAEYSVPVPSGAALRFSVGVDDGAGCTDGVTFRVTVSGSEIWHQNINKGAWHDVALSLAAYAGTTVPLRLISNPGPASDPSCDFGVWSKMAVAMPTSTISVAMQLASGSVFSGVDGASYSTTTATSGTATNVTVPGGFTIFTQQGSAVTSGTGLTSLPFDVWSADKSGGLLKSGSVFNAGQVTSETSGGVFKNPAIWAHPPNVGRTVFSWALRLPASPLKLGWSAGVIDGAFSDDGVEFEVRINGLPYWSLVTGVHGNDHWTAGQLDLSRWQGQSILLELVTDSNGNNNADWAAWADLVLTGSSVSCSYTVPASASAGAAGGTSTASITATSTCSWSATSNASWLTVVSGSGSGSGTLAYDVAPNLGDARSGTLTVAGQTLTITQARSAALPLNLSTDLVSLGIAATNMVPNQATLDAGPLFMQGVNYARDHGLSMVVADPGAYYFLSVVSNTHAFVSGIDNMTVDLHGANLIFTHPLYYGLIVYYSNNAVIQNFTTDYQPLPFTQVRVSSVDTAPAQIHYTVEPGWPDPGTFNSFAGPAGAGPPSVDVQVFRSGRRVLGRLFTQRPFNGTTIPITGTDTGTTLTSVRPGDVAVIALRYFPNAISTNHCSGCTLRNVTVFSASGGGVQAMDTQNSVMERVYSIPKPGTDRLVSTFGISMFPIAGPNNQMRLSRAIRTMDDGLALVGRFVGTVQNQSNARTLVVDGSGGPSIIGDGDTIPNGSPVTFQRYSDGVVIASALIVSQTTPAPSYPHPTTFTFDRDLPAGVAGTAVYTTDANQNGANSVVERSLVLEPQGRLYIGGLANSAARGNYIRRTALSGVFLYQSMAPGDPPTAPLTNMSVSNNVIDGTSMAPNWWWFQFGGISAVTLTTGFNLMPGSTFSNLQITNNFIADSGRSGVWLGNTNGGSVTGNYLLKPNQRPDLADAYLPRASDALKPLVIDTTSSGITTANNTVDSSSGVLLVTDATSRELAAYAPGGIVRLNRYGLGAQPAPALTLTDADGVVIPLTIQTTSMHALDVQLPAGAALGGAYITFTSGASKYFGTLFVDSQDNIPALNECTYEWSAASTTVPTAGGVLGVLVVTQPSCTYQVTTSDAFATGGSGVGTQVIPVVFTANTGLLRTTTIEIAGQTVTVTQPAGTRPVITTPPQSQRIASGQTAMLSVVAIGDAPLTYQWYVGASGNTANPIGGATGSSFTTPSLTTTTNYWVRVSNAYSPAADSHTATITVGPVSTSGMVANGTMLTVTTANAVATFNGGDLIGFVNTLTNESYLTNPSTGHMAFVDAISPTGPAMVPSNWAIGTEAGTGVPLATMVISDSLRSLTLTVKIDPISQEIVLRSSAGVTSAGVRGAQWAVAGLDLANGRWIVPAKSGVVFDRNHPGLNAYLEYPYSWHAQMAVFEADRGSFLLYSTDTQLFSKQLRQTSRGDSTLDVGVYTEAVAPWPAAATVPSVEWRLKAFAGDWRASAQVYRDWLTVSRPPLSNAAHAWVSNIRNVVGIYGRDPSVLAPLAAQLNPAQTLLYLVDWRNDSYDVNYPDYTPGPTTASLVAQAHALGFKVMLHTDLVGVSPNNADYAGVQQYQSRSPESLQLMGWNWNLPASTPQRYGIISPASSAFRALWIARIGAAVNALSPDALHLDFNGDYNDGNGLIEGRTFTQGDDFFHSQIAASFPNVALAGELANDMNYRYYSFAQTGLDMAFVPGEGHPILTFLFQPKVLPYGHLATPPASDPTFKSLLNEQQRRAAVPLVHINSTADLDLTNADNARLIGLAQSFQNNEFQGAWTADWTGALVRYQGISGATAALTDTGQLTTLSTPQSLLFQLAHNTSQVATQAFIDHWPAFDGTTLYGLDPTKLYFADSIPRPDIDHATSLPSGVVLGVGTHVTSAFARIELAALPAFDFMNLSSVNARAGVRFQGADYPLAYGAVVTALTGAVGGVTRPAVYIHPPWQGQIGGETFVEYSVPVPSGDAVLQLSVGVLDSATCSDGVTFRIEIGGLEIWKQNYPRGVWHDVALSVAAYSGATVPIRLIANPGPATNTGCDGSMWSQIALAAPRAPIDVPMTLATGTTFSGIDGAGYTSISVSSGTVTGVTVPGAFTMFTKPGTTVASGTNLAGVPFDVWGGAHGELARPGGVFGAGAIGNATSGGVTKSQTIWAHPPNAGLTMLSWVIRLPNAAPLKLGFSYGLGDGAASADGVDFSIRINGAPYWQATTQVDQWFGGVLDLARWQGQSVLLELVTDSRANFNSDWAYWADLVLSGSATSCAYSVPASASIGAIGGSFSANVTATATCSWSAVSNAPWLTIVAGSGSGSGAVTYGAMPNPGPPRIGTLTIAGKTLTVTQAAQIGACTTTISPSAMSFLSTPSPGAVSVSTPAFCAWTVSNLPPWISTTSGGSGAGPGTWTFSVSPNDTGQARTQIVSVAGTNFTATQSASGVLSFASTYAPNANTISTSEGAPYGDCDFWLMAGCNGASNLGYGPTRVMRLYICLSGEVTFSNCASAPTPTGPLSPTMLNDISTRLGSAAGGGVRLLIRFIYNMGHPGTTAPDPTAPDAPLAAILTHIDQLAPILIQNKDVIFALEAGFIGTWGEWHDSTNGNDTSSAHKAVLDKELAYFGGMFPILVRTPGNVIVYTGGTTPPAGLGIHDDYYDSNVDDAATFNPCIPNIGYCLPNFTKDQMMAYTAQVSATTMLVGEFGELNTTMQACDALDAFSYRFHLQSIALLGGFAPPVTFPFLQSSGCATSFLNRVGTRIELQRATVSGSVVPGAALSVALTLVNAGYGRVIRARPATFVLMSGGAVVAQYPISLQDMDLRLLASAAVPTPRTFQFNVVLPSTMPSGPLTAALWIPDPGASLASNPAYALPLNSVDHAGGSIFDAATGLNLIATFATGCSASIPAGAATFGSASTPGSVAITVPAGCTWSVANAPPWAVTTSGASGAGAGSWQFTLQSNGGAIRSQSMTIAGRPFTLTQLGVPVRAGGAGSRARFNLADASGAMWISFEAVGGRSYCAQLAAAPTAQAPATPTLAAFRGDGATAIGIAASRQVCFVAPATESLLIQVTQADTSARSYSLAVTETTVWANWFFIGGSYSSFTLLRNTTDALVNATITWRADTGVVVGTKTVAIPPRGVIFNEARANTDGSAAAGSVEVAHDGEPEALVGSQTTLSATTGLSFDTITMQRKQ